MENVLPIARRDERTVPTPLYDIIERHRFVYPALPARDRIVYTRSREEGTAPIPQGSDYFPQLSDETTNDIYVTPNIASGTPRDASNKKRLKALKIQKRRETQYSIRNVETPGGLDYAAGDRIRPPLNSLDNARLSQFQEETVVEWKEPDRDNKVLAMLAVFFVAIMILQKR